jgi:hypothetical protein
LGKGNNRRGQAKGEGEGLVNMVKVHMYENRSMKLVEIVLRRGEAEQGGVLEEINLIRVHCMHAWKYHYKTPLYNYANKNVQKRILTSEISMHQIYKYRN